MFEIKIEGIKTTIPFHRKMLQDDHFRHCEIHTGSVEQTGQNE